MHTLVVMGRDNYRDNMQKIVADAAEKYEKACYVSFSDPYHVVVEMMQNANVSEEKFIIIDASGNVKEIMPIGKTKYVVPLKDLFNVYLFLRNLIKDEEIGMLLLDSVSALIYNYNELPLKEMLTDLLLEVGAFRCNSSIVVLDVHMNHEVIEHINPLIGERLIL